MCKHERGGEQAAAAAAGGGGAAARFPSRLGALQLLDVAASAHRPTCRRL